MTTWRNMDGGGGLGEQVGSKPAEAKAEPCRKGLMWPVSAQVMSQNIHGWVECAKSARAYRGDDTIALTGLGGVTNLARLIRQNLNGGCRSKRG